MKKNKAMEKKPVEMQGQALGGQIRPGKWEAKSTTDKAQGA